MTDDPKKIIEMDKKGSFPASYTVNVNNAKTVTPDNTLKAGAFNRQDGSPGTQLSKVQPRTPSRNRGSQSGNTNYSRHEANFRNKVLPQKGKGFVDRRQKPRGCSTTSESVMPNDEPEVGSLQSPGGKKQNNDLWGFHFAPRESQNRGYFHGTRRSHPPSGGHWRFGYGPCTNRPKYSKDYLLANCQFLVRIGEDYTVYLADPDLLVRWDLIEEVRIRVDGEVSKCPICLDFPVAAKITKCGHIYCWPCFLHYLALSDSKTRTCPICYEPVTKNDLKSVSLMPQTGIEIGSKMEMQLMVRMKDSSVANPVEKFAGWQSKFGKILQVTPTALIQSVLVKERSDLNSMYCTDPNAPEVCFIQQALEELVEREVSLATLEQEYSANLSCASDGLISADTVIRASETEILLNAELENANANKKTRNDSVSSSSSGGFDDPVNALRHIDCQGHCYFYQINDGRNVFLHPLNMAMLWRELGSDPEKWPQTLRFEVIDIESKSITEEIRKRLKFTRHLPINSPFELVEVNMDGWGISPEVYEDFASQIKQREQRRKHRAKEEKIMERKLREREAQEYNKFLRLPKISSTQEFPAFGNSASEQEFEFATMKEIASSVVIKEMPEYDNDEVLTDTFFSPTSFAQVAGKAPIKKSPTFPMCGTSVWGKSSEVKSTAPISRQSDSENDGEDYIPVPNYRASVSDAIEKALATLDLKTQDDRENSASCAERPASGNKKKKNKKGKVLFATGMNPFN